MKYEIRNSWSSKGSSRFKEITLTGGCEQVNVGCCQNEIDSVINPKAKMTMFWCDLVTDPKWDSTDKEVEAEQWDQSESVFSYVSNEY